MTKKNQNQTTEQARDAQIIAGIGKHLQNSASIKALGTTYAPSDLITAYQAQISALASLAALKAQVTAAVAAARTQRADLVALTAALKSYLVNEYGTTSTVLSDFGFTPRKVTQKDPVTKVVAAERLRATRKERGTMGAVQKSKIKGTVPATIEINTVPGTVSGVQLAPTATTATVASHGGAPRPAGTQ
jgi:hypothetical protein